MVKISALWLFLYIKFNFYALSGAIQQSLLWKTTTACYGADDDCCMFEMICGPQQKIQLGTLLYGTKLQAQQQCTFGVADCVKTKLLCCNFDETDILTQFSEQDRQNVSDNCEGKETCKAFAPRLGTNPFSSYVIMNYTCIQALSTGRAEVNCGQPGITIDSSGPCQNSSTVAEGSTSSYSGTAATASLSPENSTLQPSLSLENTISHKSQEYNTKKITSIYSTLYSTANSKISKTLSYSIVTPGSAIKSTFTSFHSLNNANSTLSTTKTSRHSFSTLINNLSSLQKTMESSLTKGHSVSPFTVITTSRKSYIVLKSSRPASMNLSSRKSTPSVARTTAVYLSRHSPETTTAYFSTTSESVPVTVKDGLDKGLIIGLIVGILTALAIIVAFVVCLCIRIKRKERYRRNYVRKTNIFYSFPEDLKDTGSILSDCKSVETIEHDNTLVIVTNELYEPADGFDSTEKTCSEFNVDKYVIQPNKSSDDVGANSQDIDLSENDDKDSDGSSEVQSELDASHKRMNKSESNRKPRVAFDPTNLYASVSKEGKTKF